MLSLSDFSTIAYLQNGSPIQQKAFHILNESKILYHLKDFHPVLAGTMPLDIFIVGKSDLDIICEAADLKSVEKILLTHYQHFNGFTSVIRPIQSVDTLICRFLIDEFGLEIFCQNKKVTEQSAYRHMLIEHRLLQKGGPDFKKKVLQMKEQGLKTEPAFARALGLNGDPYEALLSLEE
jgi:hypothetical protein